MIEKGGCQNYHLHPMALKIPLLKEHIMIHWQLTQIQTRVNLYRIPLMERKHFALIDPIFREDNSCMWGITKQGFKLFSRMIALFNTRALRCIALFNARVLHRSISLPGGGLNSAPWTPLEASWFQMLNSNIVFRNVKKNPRKSRYTLYKFPIYITAGWHLHRQNIIFGLVICPVRPCGGMK